MKCGAVAHSAKETRQQKEPWGWGLKATGNRVEQNLKRKVGNIRRSS